MEEVCTGANSSSRSPPPLQPTPKWIRVHMFRVNYCPKLPKGFFLVLKSYCFLEPSNEMHCGIYGPLLSSAQGKDEPEKMSIDASLNTGRQICENYSII